MSQQLNHVSGTPTLVVKADGSFGNPHVYDKRRQPDETDVVHVPAAHVLRLHGVCRFKRLLVDGRIEILHGAHLIGSAILGNPGAHLIAGSPSVPIGFRWEHFSTPFESGDSEQRGNGLVWQGHHACQLHGFQRPGEHGDDWYVSHGVWGDGHYARSDEGSKFAVNLSANSIQFHHLDGSILPHVMFMHSATTAECVTTRGFGRTDRTRPIGPDNPNGAYAFHFHLAGEGEQSRIKRIYCAGSNGWGIVNHGSHVIGTNCAVVDTDGAGHVCEDQNETGAWIGCTAIGIHNNEFDQPHVWSRGEGFVAAPRVRVENCVSSDVGVGFNWTATNGDDSVRYADGSRPRENVSIKPGRMTVSGYGLFGLIVQWVNTQPGSPPFVVDHMQILNAGGPYNRYQSGVMYSYNGDLTLRRCLINGGLAGVYERNSIQGSTFRVEDSRLANLDYGNSPWTGSATGAAQEWEDSVIQARRAGVLCHPSSSTAGVNRVWRLNGLRIDAPEPVKVVDPGPPYEPYFKQTQYPNRPDLDPVNEVYVDGQQLFYPWQDG